METLFEMIAALIGAASGAMLLFGILITVLWVIMPIFVVMMNSKLKKMNTNLTIIAEGSLRYKKTIIDIIPEPIIELDEIVPELYTVEDLNVPTASKV